MDRKRFVSVVGLLVLTACETGDMTRPAVVADLSNDVTPPSLTALSFSPTSVNTSDGPASITVNYTVTDDVSGASCLQIQFRSPSGGVITNGSTGCGIGSTIGTGSLGISFAQYSESGTWRVDDVYLGDAAGNHVLLSSADLTTLGFPATLSVFSAVQDVTPPTLTALSFSPASVNTSDGPASITVNYTVTDDVSGASCLEIQFRSPSGGVITNGSTGCSVGATIGTGSLDISFAQFSESGTWTAEYVYLGDAIGNHTLLTAADVAALGFPVTVTVVNAVQVAIDIQPGSDVNSIKLRKQGKVTVAILSDAGFAAPSRVDRTSLTFGRSGNEASLASCSREGEDVNRDGFADLVCQFYEQKTAFQVGDTQGILRGRTLDQIPIEGRNAVRVLR